MAADNWQQFDLKTADGTALCNSLTSATLIQHLLN
jgi:hypothetical protein